MDWFSDFNIMHFISAFIVMFAIIDPVGTMPIIVGIRESGKKIDASKAVFYSFALMILFLKKKFDVTVHNQVIKERK